MTHITNLDTVWNHLKSENVDHEVDIQPPEKYGWLSVFCNLLQPKSNLLPKELSDEKSVLIKLSKCPFNHEDLFHMQMISTLFNKLTGLNSPAALGSHWEIVGFQALYFYSSLSFRLFNLLFTCVFTGSRPCDRF